MSDRTVIFLYCMLSVCFCCREQLAASILQEGSAGCRVVQKFLKILQVVVQEPGQTFKPFLPSILSLCIEQVYPIVAEVRWYFPSPFGPFPASAFLPKSPYH